MTEKGKYHGQRLKAREVLRLYAAGERDFRGTILRGCNFREADLSGADFSWADIRSARFVDATLRGVKFFHSRGGLQRRWWMTQLLLTLVISSLSGILQGFSGVLIGLLLFHVPTTESVASGISSLLVLVVIFSSISKQGFTLKAFGTFSIIFAAAITFSIIFANAMTSAVTGSVAFVVAFAFTITAAIAVAFTFVSTFSVAFTSSAALITTAYLTTNLMIPKDGDNIGDFGVFIFSLVFNTAVFLLTRNINRHIYQGEQIFNNIRIMSLAFSALGGTTFSGSDMTSAIFSYAYLEKVNFADSHQHPTILHHVRWHHCQKLERARLGTSALQDIRIRQLLTTLNGVEANLFDADLREADLAGIKLHRANLTGTNLNRANLQRAELQSAILTEAQCMGTDFTATQLTGACVESWAIDETTILQDVDCQYVFLKEKEDRFGNRERLPHNPDKVFNPGDFEKYFKEVLDEVKLLIRSGVDPQAFKTAFQELMRTHNISPDNVHSIQRKGPDVMVSIAVPPDQSKAEVARTFENAYERALPATTAQALLEAEQRHSQDIIRLHDKSLDSISRVLSNLQINPQINNMNNPINTGDGSVYAGRDITGSTINLGTISGQVTNQINQLPDPTPDQPNLKSLLTQLQAAIETDPELPDTDKADALEQVEKLATAGRAPTENKSRAKRAIDFIKSTTEGLTETNNLVNACKTLLPTIALIFGLVL